MQANNARHPTRTRRALPLFCLLTFSISLLPAPARADDLTDLLNNARPATAPAPVTSPDSPENQPVPATAPTAQAPRDSRSATLVLNDGTSLQGRLWTTPETPFRLWIEKENAYRDLDLALIKSIDVHVLKESMEDDWRWLKEGSDQKVYSGKKYPNVELQYRFTLLNDQVIEGSVLAPIYFADPTLKKTRTFALYKKYKGPLDSTLHELLYIKSITLEPPPPAPPSTNPAANSARTAHLPLLPE